MEKSTRSALGALLQTAQKFGKPLEIVKNSTLNQKFGVFEDILPDPTDDLAVRYVAIGNGGHRTEVGKDNLALFNSIPHMPRHTSLYKHMPFIMRPADNDLIAAERVNYRLRKEIDINGTRYAAYYLRKLDLLNTTPTLEYRTVVDGAVTSTPWEPSLDDLNPTPPLINPNQVMTTGDDYIAATARVPLVFTEAETSELINVATILYGDPGYAIISEVALCSGIDKLLSGSFNGVSMNYTEAIGVQVNDFLATLFVAPFQTKGVTIDLDAGSVEPLLVLS